MLDYRETLTGNELLKAQTIIDRFEECDFIIFRVTKQDTLGVTLAKLCNDITINSDAWITAVFTNSSTKPTKQQFTESCAWEIDLTPNRVKVKNRSAFNSQIKQTLISDKFDVTDRAPNQTSNPRKGKVVGTAYERILDSIESWDRAYGIKQKIERQRLSNTDLDKSQDNISYYDGPGNNGHLKCVTFDTVASDWSENTSVNTTDLTASHSSVVNY